MTSIPIARLWISSLAAEAVGLLTGVPLVRCSLVMATQHPERHALLVLLLVADVAVLCLLCCAAAASLAAAARLIGRGITHLTRVFARPNRA